MDSTNSFHENTRGSLGLNTSRLALCSLVLILLPVRDWRVAALHFVELVFWKRLHADNHFLHGGSDKHKLRCQQHTELGGDRSDEYCHHAGDIHLHIGERFNEHEPNGDDHLHADGDQCRRLDHVDSDRYRKRAPSQASDQFLHREPHKYHFGIQQHAELDDDRSDQYCHHAGNIHVHIRKRIDEREPNSDDHLHADCDQCRGLDHVHGEGDCNSVRRAIGDHNHFVPGRNAGRGICRLHNRRQRRLSALHIFREHEFQFPPLPEGMSLNASYGSHQQLTDRRTRHLHARICRD